MKKNNSYLGPKLLWPIFFLLMIIKFGYHQFQYFPILDDWIQYGGYVLHSNIFQDVIINNGTYMARPLASFSDPYIWAQFWGHMNIPFIIITILHAISAFFLYKVIKHFKLPVGVPFLIIYGLLPLGTEATYWISASSRLVVGIFFMSLALYLLVEYIKKEKLVFLIGFMITHIISMGYYEQVSILSAFLAFSIIFFSLKKMKHKWHLILPVFNFALLLIYYQIFSGQGNVADRGQLVEGDFFEHLTEAFNAVLYIFGFVQIKLMKNGFVRGLKLLIENKSIFYLLITVGLSTLIGIISYKLSRDEKQPYKSPKYALYSILFGSITFWIPLVLNSLLATIWICNRNVFPSFIGLALIIEGLLALIFRNKLGHIIKGSLLGLLTFIFVIVNISEIDDYKKASDIDHNIATQMIEHFDDAILSGERKVMFFSGSSSYIEQNSYHHDHIHNVTTSNWAMTGAIRAISENINIKPIIMYPWAGAKTFISYDDWDDTLILGITEDLKIIELTYVRLDYTFVELYTLEGKLFGLLEKTNISGQYYFHIK